MDRALKAKHAARPRHLHGSIGIVPLILLLVGNEHAHPAQTPHPPRHRVQAKAGLIPHPHPHGPPSGDLQRRVLFLKPSLAEGRLGPGVFFEVAAAAHFRAAPRAFPGADRPP